MPITYRIRLGRRFEPPEKAGIFSEELERYFIAELGNTPRCLLPETARAEPDAGQHHCGT
jgi:hypothetical protein